MIKDKLIIKDKNFIVRGRLPGRETIGNLRGKIIIMSIVILIVITIYHTYFETDSSEDEKENDTIPKISKITSMEAVPSSNKSMAQLFNPTISVDKNEHYLIAFEELEINGTSTIWLTSSGNRINWQSPTIMTTDLTDAKNPILDYIQDKYYIISYIQNGTEYFEISKDGYNWSSSIIEADDLFQKNESIIYLNNYFLLANQTGLWILYINELEHLDYNISAQKLLSDGFVNASILKINDHKFMIVHENSSGNFNSIIVTTIIFQEEKTSNKDIKWDLLIIFIILGIIFLSMIIHEVARD